MLRIQLVFPEHGWSSLSLRDEQESSVVRISYLTDGLGDLIRAFHRHIVRSEPVAVQIEQEGAEALLVFTNTLVSCCDSECVGIYVIEHSAFRPGLQDMPSSCSAALFTARLGEYTREVARALSEMIQGHTLEEYHEQWACRSSHREGSEIASRQNAMKFPEQEFREILAVASNPPRP